MSKLYAIGRSSVRHLGGLDGQERWHIACVGKIVCTPKPEHASGSGGCPSVVSKSEMKNAMDKLGMYAKPGSPQDFAKFIAEEAPRWNAIVQTTGVKLE